MRGAPSPPACNRKPELGALGGVRINVSVEIDLGREVCAKKVNFRGRWKSPPLKKIDFFQILIGKNDLKYVFSSPEEL